MITDQVGGLRFFLLVCDLQYLEFEWLPAFVWATFMSTQTLFCALAGSVWFELTSNNHHESAQPIRYCW